MTTDHIHDCVNLWVSQFIEARSQLPYLPEDWLNDTTLLEKYLTSHIEKEQGIVAHSGGVLAGFMAYDQLPFHGELTSFCPVIGHASVPENRSTVYRVMYRHLAEIWVSNGSLSHFITSYTSDKKLIDALFILGFGAYVIDGFRDSTPIKTPTSNIPVRKATHSDIPEVKRLAEDFRQYFLRSPIFLVSKQEQDEYYTELLNNNDGVTFVTENSNGLTGFLYVRVNDKPDIYQLAPKGVGKIDKLGAYVEEESRGTGAAVELLRAAVDWCREKGVEVIHVDHESANLQGGGFWAKYFTPSLYSLKRRINQDILG